MEGVYGSHFENQQVAAMEIFEFIQIWYNRERLHSSLGYRTPAYMQELLYHHSFESLFWRLIFSPIFCWKSKIHTTLFYIPLLNYDVIEINITIKYLSFKQ